MFTFVTVKVERLSDAEDERQHTIKNEHNIMMLKDVDPQNNIKKESIYDTVQMKNELISKVNEDGHVYNVGIVKKEDKYALDVKQQLDDCSNDFVCREGLLEIQINDCPDVRDTNASSIFTQSRDAQCEAVPTDSQSTVLVSKRRRLRHQKRRKQTMVTNEKYICHICKEEFAVHNIWKRHMRRHTVADYMCTNSVEKIHFSLKNETLFSCKLCKSIFSEETLLKDHMSSHIEQNKLSCGVCAMDFSWPYLLRRHMHVHSTKESKQLPCGMCGLKLSDKWSLSVHMRTHTGETPYECYVCDKKFIRANALKDHMKTHTGEKPYSCEICKTNFSLNTNYNKHMRMHSLTKRFSCEICKRNFPRKDYLKRHIMGHTGEKPFSCKVCSFKCTDKANLKKHVRLHFERDVELNLDGLSKQ